MKELDRFLLGELDNYREMNYNTNYTYIRVLSRDGFYFIYKGRLDNILSYDARFEFLGIFDSNKKQLYLHSDYYNALTNSDFPYKVISNMQEELVNDVKNYIETYIQENKDSIMKYAKPVFDEYYSFKENRNYLDETAVEKYLKDNIVEYKYEYKGEVTSVDNLLDYLKDKDAFLKRNLEDLLESKEEDEIWGRSTANNNVITTRLGRIGFTLLNIEYYKDVSKQIENDTYKGSTYSNEELMQLRKLYQFVKDNKENIKNANITVKHNDKELEFSYPLVNLEHDNFYEYNVEKSKRKAFEEVFDDLKWGDVRSKLLSITQIKYRGKVIYSKGEM